MRKRYEGVEGGGWGRRCSPGTRAAARLLFQKAECQKGDGGQTAGTEGKEGEVSEILHKNSTQTFGSLGDKCPLRAGAIEG